MDISKASLDLHYQLHGKIEVISRKKIETNEDLSLAYTPGVAEPCRVIAKDYEQSFLLTRRANLVAVITDGTAVLGLGDIGPAAGMPVMEGKCALFKEFAGVDAFPLCIDSKDTDEIVRTIALISKSFGGINLEDIAAPRCFEIERRLKELCDIPVFHDDQHGTAIVVAAALLNACKAAGKELGKLRIVINGAGAAGTAIAKLLLRMNFGSLILCDRQGILCDGDEGLNAGQAEIAALTNQAHEQGSLADAMRGADVFIGVSAPGVVTKEMVASMNKGIVFAMANPTPEIMPDEALAAGAVIAGTGRSDFPNQINNVLAFPGIFKGALSVRAKEITETMKVRAAHAIADIIPAEELSATNIIPSPLDKRVAEVVAKAVADTALEEGIAREQPKSLRYLVLGAGGTGGPLGAYLAKAGKDVTLIARGAQLAALQKEGLFLETTFRGNERIPVKAASMEQYQEQPDVVFVCVKYYSLAEAIPFLRRIAKPNTVVIPILNVYGTGRQLQKALPDCLVTDGCIYVSANITGPGQLKMHGPIFRVVYGLPNHRTDDPRLLQVAADLKASGITPVYSANIEKDALQKFSYVSTMAACGLYYHAEAGDMQKEGEVRQFFIQLIQEIQALAEAMGIHYEENLVDVNLRILDDLAPSASTSMQRDIAAGKPSEIDGLIYEVVRLGDRYGLALPGYRKAAERFRAEGL